MRSQIGKEISNSPSPVTSFIKSILREVEVGYICADVKVREEMLNIHGTIHGGMIALIADEAIGATILTVTDKSHVSVNLHVDYIRAAAKDEILQIKTKILKKGKSIINVECSIHNQHNKLVAKACSNLLCIAE